MAGTLSAREQAEIVSRAEAKLKEDARASASRATGNAREMVGANGLPLNKGGGGRDNPSGFRTPREFLTSIMNAERDQEPFENLDPRLKPLSGRYIEKSLREKGIIVKAAGSDEQAGINDAYGGFLIPPEFSPNVLKIDPEADPMGGLTRTVPMGAPTLWLPARVDKNHTTSVSGGLTVTRRPETVAPTASRMEFERVELRATSLMGISYASREIMEDSPISFAAILAAGFSDQFTYHLIKERLTGTGVGEFEGVLNSPALVSIAKEVGQAAATINFNNVVKMRSRCWHYERAIWIANHDTYPQLSTISLPIGVAGTAMYTPSLREDRPDMLNGRPIIYSEYPKTIGTQGDLILGNWGEYLEGTYRPLQNEESIHVRFLNHENAFKFWLRNDGRCWWRSALTPVQSSQTLSPFIVLDTRA